QKLLIDAGHRPDKKHIHILHQLVGDAATSAQADTTVRRKTLLRQRDVFVREDMHGILLRSAHYRRERSACLLTDAIAKHIALAAAVKQLMTEEGAELGNVALR